MEAGSSYVYSIGTVDARFPSIGVEKEYIQAQAALAEILQDRHRVDDNLPTLANLTERKRKYKVLTYSVGYNITPDERYDDGEGLVPNPPNRNAEIVTAEIVRYPNRYLARDMCWVFSVENIDTYILNPRSEEELTQLIDMLNEPTAATPVDVDVIIGSLGAIAPPSFCNGLELPIVQINNTYSFVVKQFIDQLWSGYLDQQQNSRSQSSALSETDFKSAANNLFVRMMQLADNVGNLDEHRAINYLALRSQQIYIQTAELSQDSKRLLKITVKPSPLTDNSSRSVMEVIFTYATPSDSRDIYYIVVDVSGIYPFLVKNWQPYYEQI